MAANGEPILIFRLGSLGDTIVALPCFHRIAQTYPDARRILVTNAPVSAKAAPVESVLGASGLIDQTLYFPPPPRRWADLLKLRAEIRRTGASTLIYAAPRSLVGALRDMAFFRACGVRKVIGAPLARGQRQLRVDPVSGDCEREAQRLARQLAALGPIDLADPAAWDLLLQPDELKAGEDALAPLGGQRFIALNVGGKLAVKDWGDDNWVRALSLLAERFSGDALVFLGAADEAARSGALAARWPGPALNLCGQLSPRQSAAALRRAALFIGHDSGPLHLAAAMGVACVGLFGDYNRPRKWHPFGDQHRIIHNMAGVRAIAPQTVYTAAAERLWPAPVQT